MADCGRHPSPRCTSRRECQCKAAGGSDLPRGGNLVQRAAAEPAAESGVDHGSAERKQRAAFARKAGCRLGRAGLRAFAIHQSCSWFVLLIPDPTDAVKQKSNLLKKALFPGPLPVRNADIIRVNSPVDAYGCASTLRSTSRTLFTPQSAMVTSSSRAGMSMAGGPPAS